MFKRGIWATGLVIVGVFIGIGVMGLREAGRPEPVIIHTAASTATSMSTPASGPTATTQPIQVFVNGAVNDPDVYVLPPGSRVKQIVEAAGGFTDEANTAVVNMALPLVDGMHIYVPEVMEGTAAPGEVITEPELQSRSVTSGMLININTAGLDELDVLPGVGPAIAQKIIDYRTANGPFPNIEAILEVSGIGEAKFDQIRGLITVR